MTGTTISKAMVVAAALAGAMLPPAARAAEPADYAFRNGAVYTVSNERPWAEAVAVKGHQIIYVGPDKGLAAYVGKTTRIVDLAGGMLLPGFIDAHVHSTSLATVADADLTDRTAKPEGIVDRLRRYVTAHPNDRLIRGTGWIAETFGEAGPTKGMIDGFIPDRPAVLGAIDGHLMWVNSKTLEIAGITADTPDPEPGVSWFQRLPGSREPSGFIVEGPAMRIITDALARHGYELNGHDRLVEGYEKGLPMLSAVGVTTVFDAGMADEAQGFQVLHELETQGRLTVRVFGSHRYRPEEGTVAATDPIGKFLALKQKYHSDYLGLRMIKVLVDASENNHTGYMLEPYADRPDTRGAPLLPAEELDKLVQQADAAGIDMHMHVVGDAAARMALDAIELAEKQDGSRDRRHALTHVIVIHPADVGRFRKLGVIWQTTPSWTSMSPRNIVVERAMGEPRFAERMYPIQDAIDQGVVVNFSSDFSSLSPSYVYKPLDQMQIGHTRQPIDRPDAPIMPRETQRVNVVDLIRGYTINGAYMLRMEDKIGSIEVGKDADLVVLDRNLFDVPAQDIHKAKVKLTMMDGKVTYTADANPK